MYNNKTSRFKKILGVVAVVVTCVGIILLCLNIAVRNIDTAIQDAGGAREIIVKAGKGVKDIFEEIDNYKPNQK